MADIDVNSDIDSTEPARRSSWHQADPFSLVMGLLFLALGGFYLAHDLTGPAALIAIGVAGLAASARRRPPR
jgi:hypothetical protein